MPAPLGWVRQFHKPASTDLPPLLICPHAGTGASAYRTFSKALSAHFDVVVFQYPGRQDRAREAACATVPEIAKGAFAEFVASQHHRGLPLTVFGHSLGAMVGFELVRLAEAAGVEVRLLAASAAVAPMRAAELPPHPTDDEQILDHMGRLEGTGQEVMANREVMRMALPVLKADYRAFDAYSCSPDVKVRTAIHALGGVEDPLVTTRDLYAWAAHSEREVEVTVFDGGHFYHNDNVEGIVELLVPELDPVR